MLKPQRSAFITAHAKINLTLDITGRRSNGYHELVTIMQSVSLADEVILTLKDSGGITLTCDNSALPQGRGNLAYRAAAAFFAAINQNNISLNIAIKKNIPSQAGLAGGSADAAAVLAGLNVLLGTGLSQQALAAIALKLGADVPFCLTGGKIGRAHV